MTRVRPKSRCCQRPELAALVWASGVWTEKGLEVYTDSASLARRLFSSLKEEVGVRPAVKRVGRPGRGKSYRVRVPDYDRDVAFGEWASVQRRLEKRRCCRRAFLRGFFMARGSVNNPGRGHHLEMTSGDEEATALIVRLMKGFELAPAVIRRKRDYVVYLKDAESIVTFLNLIGAHDSLMEFENVRVYKDLKGRVNRLVNMETANLGRTVQASVQQLEAIEVIDEHMGLHRLPPSLAAGAWARERYPEFTLEELGRTMSPPLSKSAVNHRLRRLVAWARRLQREAAGRSGVDEQAHRSRGQ